MNISVAMAEGLDITKTSTTPVTPTTTDTTQEEVTEPVIEPKPKLRSTKVLEAVGAKHKQVYDQLTGKMTELNTLLAKKKDGTKIKKKLQARKVELQRRIDKKKVELGKAKKEYNTSLIAETFENSILPTAKEVLVDLHAAGRRVDVTPESITSAKLANELIAEWETLPAPTTTTEAVEEVITKPKPVPKKSVMVLTEDRNNIRDKWEKLNKNLLDVGKTIRESKGQPNKLKAYKRARASIRKQLAVQSNKLDKANASLESKKDKVKFQGTILPEGKAAQTILKKNKPFKTPSFTKALKSKITNLTQVKWLVRQAKLITEPNLSRTLLHNRRVAVTRINKEGNEAGLVGMAAPLTKLFRAKQGELSMLQATPNLLSKSNKHDSPVKSLTAPQRKDVKALKKVFDGSFIKGMKSFKDAILGEVVHAPNNLMDKRLINMLMKVDAIKDDNSTYFEEDVLAAMTIAGINWVSTAGNRAINNSYKSITAQLGYEDDSILPRGAYNFYKHIGLPHKKLAISLGKDALKAMGLSPNSKNKEAYSDLVDGLHLEVGNYIIKALKEMDLIEVNSTDAAIFNMYSDGSKKIDNPRVVRNYVRLKPLQDKEGTDILDENDLATPNENVQKFVEQFSTDTIEAITKVERLVPPPSLKPITKVKAEIRNSDFMTAPKSSTKVRENIGSRPLKIIETMDQLFDFLGDSIFEMAGGVIGYKETRHMYEHEAIEAKNNGLSQDIQNYKDFRELLLLEEDGLDTEFYTNTYTTKTHRTQLETAMINYQANKIHRHLVGFGSDLVDRNIPEELIEFKVRVAEGIGMNVLNRTDIDIANALDELLAEDLLTPTEENSTFRAGIDALKDVLQGTVINVDAGKEAIVKAVALGGHELHTLQALNDFAVSELSTGLFPKTFREIDATTNGPGMGMQQFGGGNGHNLAEQKEDLNNTMRRVGVYTDGSQTPQQSQDNDAVTDKDDIYQSLSRVWANKLLSVFKSLSKPNPKKPKKKVLTEENITILHYLIGDMNPLEEISKIARDLAKGPTVATVYGSAIAKSVDDFVERRIIDLHARLVKSPEEAENIIESINQLFPKLEILLPEDNNFIEYEFSDEIQDALRNAISKTYGVALEGALKTKFGKFMEVRTVVNELFSDMHDMFIDSYNKEVDTVRRTLPIGRELSKEHFQEINEKLLGMMPILEGLTSDAGDLRTGIMMSKTRQVRSPATGATIDTKFTTPLELENSYYLKDGEVTRWDSKKSIKSIKANIDIDHWETPGAGSTVNGIHNMDANALNKMQEKNVAMPLMDAIASSTDSTQSAANTGNQIIYDYGTKPENYLLPRVLEAYERVWLAKKEADPNFFKDRVINISDEVTDQYSGIKEFRKTKQSPAEAFETATKMFNERLKLMEAVMNNVNAVNHYAANGVQAVIPEKSVSAKDIAKEIIKDVKELGSSPDHVIDPDTFVADTVEEVTSDNVVNIFDNLTGVGTVVDSPAHETHLRDLVSDVASKVHLAFTLKSRELGDSNYGLATGNNVIYMNAAISGSQTTSTAMSAKETYAHELMHTISHEGLDNLSTLRAKQFKKLYNDVRDAVDSDGNPIVSYKSFLREDAKETDPTYAEEKDIAESMYEYIFGTKIASQAVTRKDPISGITTTSIYSNAHHEFLAHGRTNEAFMAAIEQIDGSPKRDYRNEDTILGKLDAIARNMLDNLYNRILGTKSLNAKDKLMVLANQLSGIESRKKDLIAIEKADLYKGVEFIAGKAVKAIVAGFVGALALSTPMKPLGPNAGKIHTSVEAVHSIVRDTAKTVYHSAHLEPQDIFTMLKHVATKLGAVESGILQTTLTEMRGRDTSVNPIYDLFRTRMRTIDQTVSRVTTSTANHIKQRFNHGISNNESDAALKGLIRTQFFQLALNKKGEQIMSNDDMKKLVSDPKFLNQKIADVVAQIDTTYSNKEIANWYKIHADNLGYFMSTENSRVAYTLRNPEIIADLVTADLPAVSNREEAIELISNLASLSALKYTSTATKANLSTLMDRELSDGNNGIEFTLQYHAELVSDSKARLFEDSEYTATYGYTKDITAPNISFEAASLLEEDAMNARGFKRGNKLKVDRAAKDRGLYFYYNENANQQQLVSGIFSLTSEVSAGTNTKQSINQSNVPMTKGMVNAELRKLDLSKDKVIDSIKAGKPSYLAEDTTSAVPVFSPDGVLTEYVHMMTSATKDNFLQRNNSLDKVLGGMAGNVVNKVETKVINTKAIDLFREDYEKNYAKNPKAYVSIGKKVADPKWREAYRLLPEATKQRITEVWGRSDRMFIRADLAILAMGQRKFSITDVKHDARTHLKGRREVGRVVNNIISAVLDKAGRSRVAIGEKLWMDTIGTVKDFIVIKSGVVLAGNVTSNFILLKTLGVPFFRGARDHIEGIAAARDYQRDTEELDLLKRERKIYKDRFLHRKRILELEDSLARNSAKELIELGMLPSIIEDVSAIEERDDYDSQLLRLLKNNKHTNKLVNAAGNVPEGFKKVGKEVFMAHGSRSYQFMHDATQMSDFASRYALHKHNMRMVEAKGLKGKQLEAARALSIIMIEEVFIQYDLPTHRAVQYGNDIGVFMFSKYFLRTQKTLLYLAKHHPEKVLASLVLQVPFGGLSDITDSWLTPFNIADKFNPIPFDLLDELIEAPITNALLIDAVN